MLNTYCFYDLGEIIFNSKMQKILYWHQTKIDLKSTLYFISVFQLVLHIPTVIIIVLLLVLYCSKMQHE